MNIGLKFLKHQLELGCLWSKPTRNFNPLGVIWDHRSTSVPVAEPTWPKWPRFIQTGNFACYVFPNPWNVLHFAEGTLEILKINQWWRTVTSAGELSHQQFVQIQSPETQSTISTMAEISASDSSWATRWPQQSAWTNDRWMGDEPAPDTSINIIPLSCPSWYIVP